MIDTHAHLDGEEFAEDRAEVMARAKEAGVNKVLIPAIDYSSSVAVMQLCAQYPDFAFPMVGLHPEEVKDDWREELERIRNVISHSSLHTPHSSIIAIGEVGLDFYWSREYEKEQLAAFDEQVQWSIETGLPLMIHCRKGQNEMVHLLKQYERELPGGVFHCFTGNEREAADFLQFDRFVLGIGGVLTFKKSHLPEVLPASVPLDRIVLETDSPYMAPVPMRGKRNESAFVRFVLQKLAECYGVSEEQVTEVTDQNVYRVFKIGISSCSAEFVIRRK
ncbi:MAG: TatD family hydrolase [Prevotella sp.]|nr:TatD family hydrolase [Prevotella sp.]